MDDGSRLLTGPGAGPVLSAAVRHAGGELLSWTLEHVDANPNQSTTATYLAKVSWPYGERTELLGVSARSGELSETDRGAEVFGDGNREVAVWIYPADPDLPGLKRAAYPELHRMLTAAGVPAPHVAHTTGDQLMILDALQGRPLARAIFEPGDPCTPEQLIEVLDSMPASVAQLERRPPWSDAVQHYAEIVSSALPEVRGDLGWAAQRIQIGLAGIPCGNEPTHGDFHEGQVHVAAGRVVGILDVDTIGPGRRADDLACLIAHLSTIQRMNPAQEAKVRDLLARWVPVFDRRVDPVELRLRTAAVVISLATGPYRSQEPNWQESTRQMVRSALALVRQVAG